MARRPNHTTSKAATSGPRRAQLGAASMQSLLVCLFLCAVVLLNWPIVAIPTQRGGSALFNYLFVVWPVIVTALFVVGLVLRNPDDDA